MHHTSGFASTRPMLTAPLRFDRSPCAPTDPGPSRVPPRWPWPLPGWPARRGRCPPGCPRGGSRRAPRSRRRVRLRTTALPTALDTTKPTRGGRPARASVWWAWTTRSREPARDPPEDRTADVKSARSRRRFGAGSTGTASGGELGAALAAAGGQDRATRTGAHTKAEAVRLGATTVVRLEGPLAHVSSLIVDRRAGSARGSGSRSRRLSSETHDPSRGSPAPLRRGSRACENSRPTGPSTVRDSGHRGSNRRSTVHRVGENPLGSHGATARPRHDTPMTPRLAIPTACGQRCG